MRYFLLSVIPLLLLYALAVIGCGRVHYVAPPPPPRTWPGGGVAYVTASWMPIEGHIPHVRLGGEWKVSERDVVGFSTPIPNFISMPFGLKYIRYVPIGPDMYSTAQIDIYPMLGWLDDGYTPGVSAGLGVSVEAGDVEHTVRLGVEYMGDLVEGGPNRWNPFHSTSRTALLPLIAYDIQSASLIFSTAWSPGYYRYLLESFRPDGRAAVDSAFYFASDHIETFRLIRTGAKGRTYGYCWELRDGRRLLLRTDHFGLPDPWFGGRPARIARSFDDLRPYRSHRLRQYCWVIVDSSGTVFSADMRELDVAAVLDKYYQTGSVDLREPSEVSDYIHNVDVPIWSDFVFTIGGRHFMRWNE